MTMQVHAITRRYPEISNSIVTDLTISNPFSGFGEKSFGIWDTGATNSCVSESLAKKLNLQSIQKALVQGVHGTEEVNVYLVDIILPNDKIKLTVPVTECKELSDDKSICVLIGMDVITKGDFCITNAQGKTVMTFRVPSVETVDYVANINENNRYLLIHNQWIKHGNNKCPCGSGKLYKNCHGKGII